LKRTRKIKAENLPFIARLKMMGYTAVEVLEKLNEHNKGICEPISLEALKADFNTCKKIWAQSILYSQNEMRAEVLAEIERVKMNAWRSYEQSCVKSNRTIATIDSMTKKAVGPVQLIQEIRYGDTRCLDTVLRALQQQAVLFGLNPTEPVEVIGEKKINVAFIVDTKGKSLKEVATFPVEGEINKQEVIDAPTLDYKWDDPDNNGQPAG
jgi:hypothetical protein